MKLCVPLEPRNLCSRWANHIFSNKTLLCGVCWYHSVWRKRYCDDTQTTKYTNRS